eukprot:977184-Pyramimonas_sp.AAC.1
MTPGFFPIGKPRQFSSSLAAPPCQAKPRPLASSAKSYRVRAFSAIAKSTSLAAEQQTAREALEFLAGTSLLSAADGRGAPARPT